MSDVQSRLDNVLERAIMLDADAEQLQYLRDEWDELEKSGEAEVLFRANDMVLGQMLADGRTEAAAEEAALSSTPVTDAALAAHADARKSQEDLDWETLAMSVQFILENVQDPEEAHRLYLLEATTPTPRITLQAGLEKIVWPNGKPAEEDVTAQGSQASESNGG